MASKWSQLAISEASVAAPMIVSGQVDVFPLQWREMHKQLLVNGTAAFLQRADGAFSLRKDLGIPFLSLRFQFATFAHATVLQQISEFEVCSCSGGLHAFWGAQASRVPRMLPVAS